jgi:outer membrane protein assembly factor BamB
MPGPGPSGQPTLRWQVAAKGVTSSPTVAAGLVFVGGPRDGLLALDAATGAERWRAADVSPGLGDCVPVAAGLVYGGGHGAIAAFDVATGQERWRFAGEERFFLVFAPVVVDGVVYVGVLEPLQDLALEEMQEGAVYALDAASGNVRWRYSTGVLSATDIAVANGIAYVATADDLGQGARATLFALDTATGQERWRLRPGDRARLNPPVVAGGLVYVGGLAADLETGRGLIYALNAATGTERWRADLSPRGTSPAAVADGVLYASAGDRAVHALDAATGAERWRFAPADADRFSVSAAPSVADGVVYVSSNDGTLYALDDADGAERWRFALGTSGQGGYAIPAVVGGVVYVTALDGLYAVGGEAA